MGKKISFDDIMSETDYQKDSEAWAKELETLDKMLAAESKRHFWWEIYDAGEK